MSDDSTSAFLAPLFSPPYYAVIFASERSGNDPQGYGAMAEKMLALAPEQEGYLGVESLGADGCGITVSYWRDEAAIASWRRHAEHQVAQQMGRSDWYKSFRLRVAKVERERAFP